MAVVLGVVQMSFGIFLTIFNHRKFQKPLNIICESIPQLIFMLSIFGYLCFMIIYKWTTHWENTNLAPGLLNTLIFMFLRLGDVVGPELYSGQASD